MNIVTGLKNFVNHPGQSFRARHYQFRELWRRQTASLNPKPIFVLGNQKSGTSAITALLGEATGLTYTIDIFCLYDALEERLLRQETTLDELFDRARYYFSKDIVKEPGFTFFYAKLMARFPGARTVFVLRDPRQNIRSILNRLRLPGHQTDLSADQWQMINQQFPHWRVVLDGHLAGHQGSTYIETLALRCQRVFQIYLEHQAVVIPIRYEDFNQNKVSAIQQLAAQLTLPVTNDITFIKDQPFQPKGQAEVDLVSFFGTTNLRRIEEICGAEMLQFGYALMTSSPTITPS